MRAVANAPDVHNLIICTLCSCYPWPVLGLPPYWYKDPTFRSRAAREPRAVLTEFGLAVPDAVEIKVWDSSAQIRWFVVPERPAGTDGLSEAELEALVTPEAMMGVAVARAARGGRRADAIRAFRRHRDDGQHRQSAAGERLALLRQRVGAKGLRHGACAR